jgi:hypothetical protein
VSVSVYLDYQAGAEAHEVADVFANRMLAAELVAVYSPIA